MNLQDTHHFNFSSDQLNNALKTVGIICVGVLTLLLFTKTINEVKTYATIGEDAVLPNMPQNSISATGQSEMFVRPDITTFTWTVTAEGKTANDSENKAAEIGNKAIAFLKTKGIAEADMKTVSYYTNATYGSKTGPCTGAITVEPAMSSKYVGPDGYAEPSRIAPCSITSQVVSGYTTTQSVDVKVRDIKDDSKKTAELIAGLSEIGALSSTPMSTVDKPELYKQKVRDEAILKARQQAEVLAKALGVKLVRIISFNENSYPYPPMMYDSMMSARNQAKEASVVPDLPVGTNKIMSDVTIQYQIR